jgi:hypothetical protein
MYKLAFSRLPTDQESELLMQYVSTSPESPNETLLQWTDLAHALINTKEFIFLR